METICQLNEGKKFKKNVSYGINFAPLITVVWAGLDCELVTNTINRISRAMNKILDELAAHPSSYATNTVPALVKYIFSQGGVSGLVKYKNDGSSDVDAIMPDTQADMLLCQSATKLSNQEIVQMQQEALAHYKNIAVLPTANFTSNVLLNEDGCSLVLLSQKKSGEYAVVSQITNSKAINEAMTEKYSSDFSSSPVPLRVINETLATQCLPNDMQHTYKKVVEEAGKFSDGSSRKVVRRLVYKTAKGTFLLSSIRADSSVVTIAQPKSRVIEKVDYDLQLLTISRRQLEKSIISPRQFKTHKLENVLKNAMFPRGGTFSHHLRLVPIATDKKSETKPIDVYLSAESSMNESIYQVDIENMAKKKPLWERKASADWIKMFNSKFTNNWVTSHGQNITRPNQSVLELEFKSKVVQVNFFKKGSEYDTGLTVAVDIPAGKVYGKPCQVLSKDFATAMHGIGDLQLVSDVTIRVFNGFMQILYETDAATYQVCIPFITETGKRETEGFTKYQLVRADIDPKADRARFREEEGLPETTRRFDAVAKLCIKHMELDIERGIKPMTNRDYIRAINNYLVPFFGKRMLGNINAPLVREYEQWRNEKMGKVPISSTLATHSSAFSRIIEFAIEQGWLSDKIPIPRLSRKGRKGSARPAFTKAEIDFLLDYLPTWSEGGKSEAAHAMRLLLRDYIEILLATGMRCGKESMNMLWRHIEWYVDSKTQQRYIRIWVSGKTGGRWLIAKHIAADAFARLALRQGIGTDLNAAMASQSSQKVFSLANGVQPASLHTTFQWLMKESGLAKDAITNRQRTLYSLRHTYATMSLMDGQMDMHTLAKQMGTSIAMLEQHYSKMTATMAAERLA